MKGLVFGSNSAEPGLGIQFCLQDSVTHPSLRLRPRLRSLSKPWCPHSLPQLPESGHILSVRIQEDAMERSSLANDAAL